MHAWIHIWQPTVIVHRAQGCMQSELVKVSFKVHLSMQAAKHHS